MHFALQIRATRSDLVIKSECGARILKDVLGLAPYLELEPKWIRRYVVEVRQLDLSGLERVFVCFCCVFVCLFVCLIV